MPDGTVVDPRSTAVRKTYANGVCKVTYRDPGGNEVGFGGGAEAEAPTR